MHDAPRRLATDAMTALAFDPRGFLKSRSTERAEFQAARAAMLAAWQAYVRTEPESGEVAAEIVGTASAMRQSAMAILAGRAP